MLQMPSSNSLYMRMIQGLWSKRMTDLIFNNAVCRTALATLELLEHRSLEVSWRTGYLQEAMMITSMYLLST